MGITWEKLCFIKQGKSKSFKTLIETFHELRYFGILFLELSSVPVKNIPRIVYLVIAHIPVIAPGSCLDKMYLQLLIFELYRKPSVVFLQLINKFKERTFLQHPIAVLILNICQLLEEDQILYLWVAQNISEGVGESCIYFQEGLQSQSIDIFETFLIEVGKILNLKFSDQRWVGLRQEEFS